MQDISEEDAKAEGVIKEFEMDLGDFIKNKTLSVSTYRLGFKHLWDPINAKRGYGWAENPVTAVIEFEVKP